MDADDSLSRGLFCPGTIPDLFCTYCDLPPQVFKGDIDKARSLP